MYAHLPGSWSLAFWGRRCPVLALTSIDDRNAQASADREGKAIAFESAPVPPMWRFALFALGPRKSGLSDLRIFKR
jgi:hypothetical protein